MVKEDDTMTAKELQNLPEGTVVSVTEIKRDRLGGSKPGVSWAMEVGTREGKKVLYSLPPWRSSSFLPIRDYKNLTFNI